MAKCASCKKPAQIKIAFAPFCESCFLKHYQNRVERLIKKFKLIEEKDKILVAVSGGKDSMSCAHVLSKLRQTFKFEMGVLHIDVGVSDCTNKDTENIIRDFCNEYKVPFYLLKIKEYLGLDIKEVSKKIRRPICSICGMVKRYALNKFARENGFNKIATGHCADDITLLFFKNWFSYYFDWIAKFKPIMPSNHPKIVTRIRPLFECLEEENLTYVKLNKIKIAGCSKYSYSVRKDKLKEILKLIDSKKPDFKINFVRALERVEIKVKEPDSIKECIKCGEPTDKEICGVCRLKM